MSMKGKLLEFPVTAEIPIYGGGPILPYVNAAAVRADLDLLSDTELEAIYAATEGDRTPNALVKYDASGRLVKSGAIDNGSTFVLSLPLGLGAPSPARRLEVRDATAQVRLSHTPGVHWVDLQAMSGGALRLFSSAGSGHLEFGRNSINCSASMAITALGSPVITGGGVSAGVDVGAYDRPLYFNGNKIGFFFGAGASQMAHVAAATDLATALTLLNAWRNFQIASGLMAAS